jgi:HemY protein
MIRLVLILLGFFAVMALSPFLIDEKGYILIAMGDITIESTVLSAIIMLTIVFVVLLITLKVFRGGLKLTFGSWNKIVFAGQRRGIANFNKGLAAFMLEDYNQAEQLFSKSAVPSKRKQSAYLLAAAASAKQDLDSNTNHYLTLLEKETSQLKDVGLESVIVQIKLLMNQNKAEAYGKARALMDENHKQIGHDMRLLSLEIDLCLIEQRFENAINYLTTARKDKALTDDRIQAWERQAYYGVFNETITQHDSAQLTAYWQNLSKKIKQRETIVFAYCRVLAEQKITEPLNKLLLPMLKKSPNSEFLKQLRQLPISQADDLIAQVQKHLHKDIHSGKWLSCLGHLALASKQYAMAEKAFASLVKLEQENYGIQYDQQDLQAFAKAHSAQGHHQAANDVWLKASHM